jgi:homoserine kinase type II
MALLTPLHLAQARALGRRYGLGVARVVPIAHGSVNSNFALELEGGGCVFLRLYEESTREEAEAQAQLCARLVARGVPTPAPLARADAADTILAEHAGKPVAVFPWCEGDAICQGRVDGRLLVQVGGALGRLHLAGSDLAAPPNRFGPEALGARLASLAARAAELAPEVRAAIHLLGERLAELAPLAADASTVVHGDVFRDNVLWRSDGRLGALLDFESASRGDPMFDLMVTLLAWCFGAELEQRLARALVAGYAHVRLPTDGERERAFDAARMAALRFGVTRITDYELRPRDVVVHKDYRRFLARLAAVEAIGRARFADWVGL